MRANANTAQITAFAARIGRMIPQIGAAFAKSNLASAKEMERRGKRIAPKSDKAPHIADTIKAVPGDQRLFEYIVSVGDAALIYAAPVEFGHINADGSHTPANPFWVPLTRIMLKKNTGRCRRALRKALRVAFP